MDFFVSFAIINVLITAFFSAAWFRYRQFLRMRTTRFADPDSTEQILPFLVYGTLRPGGGNYENFFSDSNILSTRTVTVSGLKMYGLGNGYPYCVADKDSTIIGTLITVSEEDHNSTLEGTDWLEGFRSIGSRNNHYDRKVITFWDGTKNVQAWVYIAAPRTQISILSQGLPVVDNGDWLEWVNEGTRV